MLESRRFSGARRERRRNSGYGVRPHPTMPTNPPPQYFEVEKRYKAAVEPQEKAQLLEELLGTIPKHKGTDHLRADLRRRPSKLKAAAQQSARKSGRRQAAYQIEREGAGAG